MHKLTFALKQHTPIIHFQHDQDGATLRATEVKPKLDRFIIDRLLNIKEEFKSHLNAIKKIENEISNKKSSYKLRIDGYSDINYSLPLARFLNNVKSNILKKKVEDELSLKFSFLMPTTYFGNEDKFGFIKNTDILEKIDSVNLKFAVKSNDLISAAILTYDDEIYQCIKDALPYFFAFENFGARQNKGFGCFEIKSIDNVEVQLTSNEILKPLFNNLYEKHYQNQDWSTIILEDYKLLKSGRGRKEGAGYAKSKLFIHFAEMPSKIRWEKRFLKKQINGKTINSETYRLKTDSDPSKNTKPIDVDYSQNWSDSFAYDYKYIRALLGLAEQFEFDARPDKLIVKISSNDIERFKSPIIFKVYDDKIYLCCNEIPQNHPIFNHSFKMEYYPRGKKNLSINITNPPSVPRAFSLKNFLDFALLHDTVSNTSEKIKGYKITTL